MGKGCQAVQPSVGVKCGRPREPGTDFCEEHTILGTSPGVTEDHPKLETKTMSTKTTKTEKSSKAAKTEKKAAEEKPVKADPKAEKKAAKAAKEAAKKKAADEKKAKKAADEKKAKKAAAAKDGKKVPMRTAFRNLTKHAHDKKDGKMGTRKEVVEKFTKDYPEFGAEFAVSSYITWAKAGTIPDCYTLTEDAEGNLKTGKLVPSGRKPKKE